MTASGVQLTSASVSRSKKELVLSFRLLVIAASLVVTLGCNRSFVSPSTDWRMRLGPVRLTIASTTSVPTTSAGAKEPDKVLVDTVGACDEETFDAALGAGTCRRKGAVQGSQLTAALTRSGSPVRAALRPRSRPCQSEDPRRSRQGT